MKLSRKRQIFTWRLADLIHWARLQGYEVACDEVRRGPQQVDWNVTHCSVRIQKRRCEQRRAGPIHHPATTGFHPFKAIGIRGSLHNNGLAADLLLFHHGAYLIKTDQYEALGLHWESYTGFYDSEELTFVWGGRFQDGGHFSIAHSGRR